MQKIPNKAIINQVLLLCIVLFYATVSTKLIAGKQAFCMFDDVIIDYGFEMGRISQCKKIAKNKFALFVGPEHTPINKSPWYAFSVSAEKTKNIEIYLHYSWHKNRYLPKISTNKTDWKPLDPEKYQLLHNNKVVKMSLKVSLKPQYIAAQEIIDNSHYNKWLAAVKKPEYQISSLGLSKQGRKIKQLVSRAQSKNWVLVVGRQHPAEVTGAIALLHFMKQVLADSDLAKQFRKKYNILLVPNLNPDGVAHGHWRYNMNLQDINRDWGIYEQPSIKLVGDAINEIYQNSARLILGLDFHSTNKDVFYTQPDNTTKILPLFTKQWLGNIQKRIPDYTVLRQATHNPGLPTFKTGLASIHDMPAITYELGDETNRETIRHTSTIAAEEMMQILVNHDWNN